MRKALVALAVAGVLFMLATAIGIDRALYYADSKVIDETRLMPTPSPIPSLDEPQERESEEMMEDSDLYWLARAMQEEDGPNWPDAFVMMIGEVVLNRVGHDGFPNTVKDVVLQEGQYEPFFQPFERFTPGQRYIRLARRLMAGERIIDDPDVIWQALFPQGSQTVVTVYDEDLQTTTYFCK